MKQAPVPVPGTVRSSRWTAALSCRCAISAILAGAFAVTTSSRAPQQVPPEDYQVKADYLTSFSRFVDWPAPAATSTTASGTPTTAAADTNTAEPFVKEILSSVQKFPVPAVSDLPNFLAKGGTIEFVVKEDKVRFAVNVSVAARAGLTVSSQLLKVAAEIKKDPADEPNP